MVTRVLLGTEAGAVYVIVAPLGPLGAMLPAVAVQVTAFWPVQAPLPAVHVVMNVCVCDSRSEGGVAGLMAIVALVTRALALADGGGLRPVDWLVR